nr:hypothetical protein [Ardenticatena sp.]
MSDEKDKDKKPSDDTMSNLPDWLRDLAKEQSDAAQSAWTDDIDFSELPEWLVEDEQERMPEVGSSESVFVTRKPQDPAEVVEGSGLLAGVPNPIPIEPIIVLPHKVPPFPSSMVGEPSEAPSLSLDMADTAQQAILDEKPRRQSRRRRMPPPKEPSRAQRTVRLVLLLLALIVLVILIINGFVL